MINQKINSKIVTLWDKYFEGMEDVYAPLFYDNLKTGSLLFIGVNPSFSVSGYKSVMKDTEYADLDPEKFFTWRNISSTLKYVDDCVTVERYAKEKYKQYFKRMNDIANAVGLPWHDIDTFLYKETSQKDFIKRIYDKSKLNSFAKDQLEIFKEVLEDSKPKVIVVANAFASGIIQEEFKDQLSFDEERGYHLLKLSEVKTPIFFSSMLTGQRALDVGSYERLLWHIKQAVNYSPTPRLISR